MPDAEHAGPPTLPLMDVDITALEQAVAKSTLADWLVHTGRLEELRETDPASTLTESQMRDCEALWKRVRKD